MVATGSIDVTGAALTQEVENSSVTDLGQADFGTIVQFIQIGDSQVEHPIEYFFGVIVNEMFSFAPEQLSGGSISIGGTTVGPSNFGVISNGILILGDFGQTILLGGGASHTVYNVDATSVFSGQTFESMGLSHHPEDVPVDIWKASVAAGDEGALQLVVSSVPEPSVFLLGSLAGIGLLVGRRR
ncbi:hypothetical protein GCM10007100_03990 [Roseibacillus persicicus]|uniref:PEP-CTERM protein-sorting domain-containing protein n=2 Tax=Roseibacillus persicicus TaxID=454148 RepID=A0A918TCZ5_9BACT|nr:hypothetical protein GCM10007100_03990 [Roseibacillus persicicus]